MQVELRRLTRDQLHYSVRDLLGPALPDELDVRPLLPVDEEANGFSGGTAAPMTELAVEQIERAAEAVAEAAVRRREHLSPCLGEPAPSAECLTRWIDQLASRAFRRPLSSDELGPLHDLVSLEPTPESLDAVDAAIHRALMGILQSPDFLYRVERGLGETEPGIIGLTDHEIAVRLSYLVWSSVPDEDLRTMADDGRLRDPLVRREQLARMLADPRARRGMVQFHRQWLELGALPTMSKDRKVFPTYDESLRPLIEREFETFVDAVIRGGDGRLGTLLSSRSTFVHPALVPWYGDDIGFADEAPPPVELPEGFVVAELDDDHRAGVLTQLAVLSVHAKAGRSAPVARGALIRRRLLCDELGAPPPDLPMNPPEPSSGSSQRDQLQQHAEDPTCSGCHELIDPLGWMFESYDAMGSRRTQDLVGNPIDTSGAAVGSDIDGELPDAVALAEALSNSEQVQRCYARQWLRHALGTSLATPEDLVIEISLEDRFVASEGHVPTLLEALVVADAFARRRVP